MSDVKDYAIIIPIKKLSKEALNVVIEEFVIRDGTDYGLVEIDLEQKLKGCCANWKKAMRSSCKMNFQ